MKERKIPVKQAFVQLPLFKVASHFCAAFPVSGMVTIPVSMYHGMQVTMAPVVSAEAASSDGNGETVEMLAVPVSQQQVD